MKKIITTTLLFSLVAFAFAAPKKVNSNNVRLNPKDKFAIEGVELGTFGWAEATVNAKGEITWSKTHEGDWHEIGWDARGIDLSQYGAIRVELAPNQNQELQLKLSNPASIDEWGYNSGPDGIIYAFFNGVGKDWGNMKNPDLEEGFLIRLTVPARKYAKTVFKSVELIKQEDIPDAADIEIMGVPLGSICQRETRVIGNELTWLKGYKDCSAGWDLTGIDLSEYDRIRIELESNTATNIGLRLTNKDWKNWYGFDQQVEQNVWEADLTGEGFSWKWDDSVPFDKTQGMIIVFQNWHENPLAKEEKTIIKSVQLLKGKKVINENLMIENVTFGSPSYRSFIKDNGLIEWDWDKKEKYPYAGWKVSDLDLSAYRGIRIELESTDITVDIRLIQKNDVDCHIGFDAVSPTVLEANFDGSGCSWSWPQGAKWNPDNGIEEIHVRAKNLSKAGLRTVIKSVHLISKEEKEVPQPENLVLNGAKLGSKRDHAWVEEDFSIKWEKANWAECGWKLEKLEGNIVEIKVSSTDVPLRLRIRESDYKNDTTYVDDGSHIFRINLKTKKQINAKGGQKEPEWTETSKAFNFSNGAYICLEPQNGVYKEGKKTVVESIKIE